MIVTLLLLACASAPELGTAASMDAAHAVTDYNLDWTSFSRVHDEDDTDLTADELRDRWHV